MINSQVRNAILDMYSNLDRAAERQFLLGKSDQGRRSEMTSGHHLDRLADRICDDLCARGVPADVVFDRSAQGDLTLPGWYRSSKDWDVTVIDSNVLVAAVELKSISSSFGNNLNNRIEEVLGSVTDASAAFHNGLYGQSPIPPSFGYVMIARDCAVSRNRVRSKKAAFPTDIVFDDSSYLDRLVILCKRLLVSRLYQAVWLVFVDSETGEVYEPSSALTYEKFITALVSAWELHAA